MLGLLLAEIDLIECHWLLFNLWLLLNLWQLHKDLNAYSEYGSQFKTFSMDSN